MAHSSIVGGSSAGRVIACPGSRTLPQVEFTGNRDTWRGTLLHKVAEDYLMKSSFEPYDYVGDRLEEYALTEDDIDDLTPHLDAWENYANANGIETVAAEQTVRFPHPELAGVFGTADIIARSETAAFVMDWKFGYHRVAPEENAQGMFYAAAAALDPATADLFEGVDDVVICIIQHGEVREWRTNKARLNAFVADLIAALDSDDLNLGPHCMWCRAKTACPLQQKQLAEAAQLPLTIENLSQILAVAPQVETLIREARTQAHELLEAGHTVPGWKLVEKRPRRVYTDPTQVEDICKRLRKLKQEDYYDLTLKSPAQLEKVCKRKGVDFNRVTDYIVSVSSGTTLAPADDERPAVPTFGTRKLPANLTKLFED